MKIHEVLSEVAMNTSVFNQFLQSKEAAGIRAGFEAELCFAINVDGGGESEIDYDMDESCADIDDICRFFGAGDNSRGDIRRLRDSLNEDYSEYNDEYKYEQWNEVSHEKVREYIEENEWDQDSEVVYILENEMGLTDEEIEEAKTTYNEHWDEANEKANERLDEKVDDAYSSRDSSYDAAEEEFMDSADDADESDFLNSKSIYTMIDVSNTYDISWPYYTGGDSDYPGWDDSTADMLANEMEGAVGATVRVSNSYGGARRDNQSWIIEPDSSLEPDDGEFAAEFISPPMELGVCLEKLDAFASWAKSNGAYANDSTGFHVGVSLPHVGGKVDYVKLAMFLGDKYVLEQFGRASNAYCKRAAIGIQNQLRRSDQRGFDRFGNRLQTNHDAPVEDNVNSKVQSTMNLLRGGLYQLASSALLQRNNDRYTSINMKDDYIEFRIGGGDDYISKFSLLKDSILRYAYAMTIASNPAAYKQEYSKKLYKFLTTYADKTDPTFSSINLFAQYQAGMIPIEELKQALTQRNAAPNVAAKVAPKPVIPGAKPPAAYNPQQSLDF
jgi:vacuolar-type H+-ATPase subunit H